MKQYTTPEQTAKLIELGFEKPMWRVARKFDDQSPRIAITSFGKLMTFSYEDVFAYSVGELIKILEDVASIVMSYSYQKNGYYVRVIIPKREGGGMYRISQIELIDALYDMCVKLKEEDVI
ncbi:MAG: hypothetical protein IJF01_07335 [Tidjanibacter sp.]|nr:hypothetical protein [Tidjanibacter sp.]